MASKTHLALGFVFLLALAIVANPLMSSFTGNLVGELTGYTGTSYATEGVNGAEYDRAFGVNWQSVRTFRLLRTLDQPIRIYVDKNSPLYKTHYQSYISGGFKSWAAALDGRLSYQFVSSPKNADITVGWVTGFSDRLVAGVTTYRVGSARIQMKAVGVPDADVKANIIHEIGHALGVTGHSQDPEDIMVGVRKWSRTGKYDPKLSTQDVQAIRRLYSADWHKGEDLYAAIRKQETVAPSYIAEHSGQSQVVMQAADKAEMPEPLPDIQK